MLDSRKKLTPRKGGVFLLLAMLLVGLLGGCSGEKPEQFLAKAQQQYEKGDRVAAVIELKNAVQKDPDYAEARLLLGKIYIEQGDGASAEKELRRALQLGAKRKGITAQLGRALLLQREFKKVLEEVPAAPDGTPVEAAAMLAVRGDALAMLKQLDEAKAAYEAARKLDPAQVEATQGLAALAMLQGQPEEAMRLADEAIQQGGKRAEPWILKANLLQAQGNTGEAMQAYQEAVKRDPNSVTAHLSLAALQIQKNEFEAAQRAIEAARKVDSNSLPVRLTQAQLDFSQKKYAQARDGLQEILKVAPNHGPAVLMMGATQLALGAPVQAETYLSAYVKSMPTNAYARRLLAATYLQSKQPGKAIDILNPLLTAGTEDGAVLALAGDAYMQLKEYGKATEYLEKAAKASPDSAALRAELAMSRMASGDVARGTAELEAAAAMEGSPIQTDVTLVYALLSKKEYERALKAIDALEKKDPNNPLVHNLRGGVLVAKQDMVAARKSFEKALSLNPAYYPAAANLAQMDLREKKPEAARKRFESVLAADKNSVAAMVAIAGQERNTGNEKGYVDWLDKAARADAKALSPRALLVQHYIAKKEVQRALTIAREAQTANPGSVEALDLLGTAQLAAGEKDNAVATFGKLITLAPQSPLAYLRLASAQMANKSPNEARKSLNKALEMNPNLMDAQLALIGLDMQEGRSNDAIKRATQIEQQQPKSPAGNMALGDIYFQQREFAKAAEQYQKGFDLGPNGPTLIKLHAALLRGGKGAEAETKVTQWLKEHPDDHGVRLAVAESQTGAGEYAAATTHYLYLNQKLPGQVAILNNLAYALAEQKDKRATTYAEEAYKLQPANAAVLDTYGWALVQTGQTAKGLGYLQQALSKAPDVGDIQYHYAAALASSGDKKRAQQELDRLLKSGVEFGQKPNAVALMKTLQAK